MKITGLTVAIEMFAVFEAWGRPDTVYNGQPFKLCSYDKYGKRIFVVHSGPGQAGAEAATRMLTEKFNVEEVWNFGVAGALVPGLSTGDICAVRDVVRWDAGGAYARPAPVDVPAALRGKTMPDGKKCVLSFDDSLSGGAGPRESGRLFSHVRCASGNSDVSEYGERVDIASSFDADIVDMEAAGIVAAAAACAVPCFVIKCISDDLNTPVTDITKAFRASARAAFNAFDIAFMYS